jgi:FkbH-like protein
MLQAQDRNALLEAYLQADAPNRADRFGSFINTLKDLGTVEGEQAAREWARRAISPLLDYSSLMKLRCILAEPSTQTSAIEVLRLAILGGPTTIQLRQLIEVFLAGEHMAAEIYEADYGLFRQEILTPGSGLDRFGPEVVFLATGAREVGRYPRIRDDIQAVCRLADDELRDWIQLWETCAARWGATVLQNNFEIPPGRILGHYSLRHPGARENYLSRLNGLLAERAPPYVVLHDLQGLAADAGSRHWFDPRFYLEFKMPCAPAALVDYAYSLVSLLRALRGRSKKVLVVDLDNTLWGGVVGDLGVGGIRLGQGSGEGEAFLAFQQYAKELGQRGILLAVCSKNDPDRAREPFEKRPDMILELSDVACFVANWESKRDNLRVIAKHLNVQLDSLVFVDDNAVERALVRRMVPEVAVPDMPDDPAGFVPALALHRYFETVSFTREDAARTGYYREDARRRDAASRSADLNSFLQSLAMKAKVERVNEVNIERVTQLVNKSNQFNLTTRRYTLEQMRALASDSGWCTLALYLRDDLGDNGLISVLLLRQQNSVLAIDTWVMSCRVLQRGVEQFARNELVELARRQGCATVTGTYIPTAKNGLVKNLLADLGFELAGQDSDRTYWRFQVDRAAPMPHFIERENGDG